MTDTETATDYDVQNRIRLGAAWLDKNVPDWRSRVSLPKFDITSTCDCVLGQVFKTQSVAEGYGVYGFDYAMEHVLPPDEAVALGFDAQDPINDFVEFRELQEAWDGYLRGEWE